MLEQHATGGPYRRAQHPAYASQLVSGPGIVLLLGSAWAWAPFIVLAVVIIVRTALEDRTLRAELPGYQEYAQQTRYRLLPGIW